MLNTIAKLVRTFNSSVHELLYIQIQYLQSYSQQYLYPYARSYFRIKTVPKVPFLMRLSLNQINTLSTIIARN